MKRLMVATVAALALIGAGCGASGSDKVSGDATTTAPGAPTTVPAAAGTFGTLKSPSCGKDVGGKKITVKASEAGGSPDVLRVGTANDRTSTIRPGLLKEMWDASAAFTKWCNDQGGIGGMKIDLVDLDGQLLKVEDAMATACKGTFMMVGGGWVQDQLMFSGKPESDFHLCKMAAVPGFTVSPEFSGANGQFQALPTPIYVKPTNWIQMLVNKFPDKMAKTMVLWGNLPSLKSNMEQIYGTGAQVPGFGKLPDISYDAIGTPDWSIVAQQVIDSGAKAVTFVGEPTNLSKASQALKAQNWDGILFADANQDDPVLLESSGPEAVEGLFIRGAGLPRAEADKWPATKQYLDILKNDGPADAKIAGLSMQAFSSWLLFAQGVTDCATTSGGEVSRDCVLEAISKIDSWDGGGLHAVTDPGKFAPSECAVLLTVKGGALVRAQPDLGSKDDNGQGFFCSKLATLTGDFGQGKRDPSRKF